MSRKRQVHRIYATFDVLSTEHETVTLEGDYGEAEIREAVRQLRPFDEIVEVVEWEEVES